MTERRHGERCKRYGILGQARCLTFSCFRRQLLLMGDRSRRWLAEALQRSRRLRPSDLWAYVFMPEHAHRACPRRRGHRTGRDCWGEKNDKAIDRGQFTAQLRAHVIRENQQ